jgi:hypothetical protein
MTKMLKTMCGAYVLRSKILVVEDVSNGDDQKYQITTEDGNAFNVKGSVFDFVYDQQLHEIAIPTEPGFFGLIPVRKKGKKKHYFIRIPIVGWIPYWSIEHELGGGGFCRWSRPVFAPFLRLESLLAASSIEEMCYIFPHGRVVDFELHEFENVECFLKHFAKQIKMPCEMLYV